MQVENGGKFYFMSSVHNRYVTRLVLKHRILAFKLDFKLDLLKMTLNFMLLQDSYIRHIRVRSKVIILNITDNLKRNRFLYSHFPCFYLTVHKFLSYTNTELFDFIHCPWEKLETSDKQNKPLRWTIQQHTQLSYNKLPCINLFQPPPRPSCHWKPNFKQKFHQLHSVHIILWNPESSEKRMGFRKLTHVYEMHPLPLCMNMPSS